ncbi:hypothetical protein JYU34_014263 [Plutella xylostella]|uniref:Chitin-binding type-2 domain-containing protein n=1 Tax=Plutella xylostella TaxID=51655 RepID=A0ABQ7Q7X4_PLUXY|nr:hypothetical protein JYU34_014263 [Plutella xylostella]
MFVTGYYADIETDCQAFRVCTAGATFGFQSFLCPNGTLFNQAVVVCDWWMNVKCENTQQHIDDSNQKFSNLRVGTQFMHDIQKMLTHPMRNPYDQNLMKGNLIVMQEYRPPAGQLFPMSSLTFGSKNRPENVYVPSAKLVQQSFDNAISASTVSPLYSAPANRLQAPRGNELFQKQQQYVQSHRHNNGHYVQPNSIQSGKYVQPSLAQSGKYVEANHQENSQKYNQQTYAQNSQYQNHNYDQPSGNINQNSQSSRLTQQQNAHFTNNALRQQQEQQQQILQQQQQLIQQQQQQQLQQLQQQQQQLQQQQQRLIQQNLNYNQGNIRYNQAQANIQLNELGYQRGQVKQTAQYTDNSHTNNEKQKTQYDVEYTKQQYTVNQDKQNTFNASPYSNQINGKVSDEAKQNLVSTFAPATVIAKTLTFNRIIQEPKPGSPKSRITIKSWIVKPSKSAKLTAGTTPYTYDKPTNPPPAEKLIVQPTGYYYSRPTTQAQKIVSTPEPYYYNPPKVTTPSEKIVSEPGYTYNKPTQPAKLVTQPEGYSYQRPTQAAKQVSQVDGYVYNKPTVAAKQITVIPPTQPSRQYLTPSPSPPPTVASRLYLAPTTFKPIARFYLPAAAPSEPSRQYLNPNAETTANFQSAKLQASPTSPTPVVVSPTDDKPSFSLIKHSRFNAIRNNLTFTDILTKEKLDITVNDIVKDTRNILGTAQPQQFGQLRNEESGDTTEDDYREENYITSVDSFTESGENLSPATPTVQTNVKSSRLIVPPAADLEPPVVTVEQTNQNTNRLANLPFFKEPPIAPNTIERTVSLKISIPEKTAAYLFKNTNESDYDKLEILNTGSSNYLVLTNKVANSPAPNFIPIGKLIFDKNNNFSNSQALVFSFLTDSINQAREYKNIAEQNLLQSHTPFQNINNEELAKITNEVAQLTSAQFTANNNNNFNHQQQANIASTAQNINSNNQLGVSAKYTNNIPQHQVQQQTNLQSNSVSQQNLQSGQFQTTRFQGGQQDSLSANLQINNGNNQLYSGQLYQVPVPDVSSLYNGLGSGKLIAQNNNRQQHTEAADLHQGGGGNDIVKQLQSSGEVEIVQSQSVPYQAPAKLQAAPQTFNSQEDTQSILGNFASGNGISAQLSDKIVGTIPHPSEENKLVTYKKDQSYYVYTKLDDFHNNGLGRNTQANNGVIQGNNGGQSAKLTQSSNADNVVSFQLIPSVGYQLEDEREQQRLLNAFNIDEFTGSPRVQNQEVRGQNGNILTSNVEYSVEHPVSQGQYNRPSTLYAGPSSYSAPQASVGRLEQRAPAAAPAKIEQLEDNTNSNSGYSNGTPSRSFTFRK